jgi:hypothetical protein
MRKRAVEPNMKTSRLRADEWRGDNRRAVAGPVLELLSEEKN